MPAPVSLIWAMTRNRVIGRCNQLPWQLKTDMQHFVNSTRGKPVVMGRKQFESMGKALPGRQNIVLTRNTEFELDDAEVVDNIESAIAIAQSTLAESQIAQPEVMIIGGAEIYALALPYADRLYMTEIETALEGDTFFPEFELSQWHALSSNAYSRDEFNDYDFVIKVLERAGAK